VKRLLSDVYLERRCNVCGETYPLTLYEILLTQREQRLAVAASARRDRRRLRGRAAAGAPGLS
jgi:hypothetical protein